MTIRKEAMEMKEWYMPHEWRDGMKSMIERASYGPWTWGSQPSPEELIERYDTGKNTCIVLIVTG